MYFDLENEFKYQHREHVKFYLGLKYSIDGWSYLYGIKIAGLKVKFPLIFVDHSDEIHEHDSNPLKSLKNYAIVAGIFFGGTYLMKRISDKLDSNRIQKWLEAHLLEK